MIIEERVERSQYVKLITWIVSFIILMAGIVFPVLILRGHRIKSITKH